MTPYEDAVDRARRAIVTQALTEHGWCVARAAGALGIRRNHVYYLLRRWGLSRPAPERSEATS